MRLFLEINRYRLELIFSFFQLNRGTSNADYNREPQKASLISYFVPNVPSLSSSNGAYRPA